MATGPGAMVVDPVSAPVVDPTRPLRREHELTICAHFGIGEKVGRGAAVASRAPGGITATPPAHELIDPTHIWVELHLHPPLRIESLINEGDSTDSGACGGSVPDAGMRGRERRVEHRGDD